MLNIDTSGNNFLCHFSKLTYKMKENFSYFKVPRI